MPSSSSSSRGPLVCPRCAVHYSLEERFCERCGMPLVYAGRTGEEPLTETHERVRKIKPQYTRGEPVKVGFARNQAEAELIQGLLLEEGIPSMAKRTRGFDVPDFLAAGPRDVLVPQAAEEAARDVLANVETEGEVEERQEVRDEAGLTAGSGRTPAAQLLFWILVGFAAAAAIVWLLYQATG
jgi:Putative prokaryotic signal transducing protein